MSASASRLFLNLVVVLVLVVPASAVPVPDQPKTEKPKVDTAAEKIRKALDQPTSVDFQNTMLSVAMESLHEQTRVNFIVDRATLLQLGYTPESLQVQLRLENVKLKTVLKHLLSQYNMTYVIDQDIVLITTEAMAVERQMRQRVTVDLDNVPLDQALQQLARETGASNLIIDPRHAGKVKDKVTVKLEDVPLETAVRVIAEIAGLRSVRLSNVLFVTSSEVAEKIQKENGAGTNPNMANPFPLYYDMSIMRPIRGW